MVKILHDGLDQYVLFRASKDDYSGPFVGASNGDALPGAVLILSEYKKADVTIPTPSVIWVATSGVWKATIPASRITQNGTAWLNVSGTGMLSLAIEVDVVPEILTLTSISAVATNAITSYAPATAVNLATANNNISAIKLVTDNLNDISVSDITSSNLMRTIQILLTGSVTGLTDGYGSPVTFTGTDGSTVVFTVDVNGNRTLSAINLV